MNIQQIREELDDNPELILLNSLSIKDVTDALNRYESLMRISKEMLDAADNSVAPWAEFRSVAEECESDFD
jgi:hypothetical protein